jgi:hypothetical protein
MLEVGNSHSCYPRHRAPPHGSGLGCCAGEERLYENNDSKSVKLYSRQSSANFIAVDNLDFEG